VDILKAETLYDELVEIGRKLAMTMVELFAGLPPEHEFFEQFSFIAADDLPDYRALLARVGEQPVAAMSPADQQRLLSLAFKLIPARHRLDLLDEGTRQRILNARQRIARELPESCRKSIAFFDSRRYNAAATLEDNIMFGKLVHGAAQARERVGRLIDEILGELDLREDVIQAGLDYEVGIAGGRLSPVQRQKLAVARALLKSPDILILNEATSGMDTADDERLRETVFDWMEGKRVIWILGRQQAVESFDRILVMEGGRVVEDRRGGEADAAAKQAAGTAAGGMS
jgi:ABC-type iron transport system FetAB ATPase subunit